MDWFFVFLQQESVSLTLFENQTQTLLTLFDELQFYLHLRRQSDSGKRSGVIDHDKFIKMLYIGDYLVYNIIRV